LKIPTFVHRSSDPAHSQHSTVFVDRLFIRNNLRANTPPGDVDNTSLGAVHVAATRAHFGGGAARTVQFLGLLAARELSVTAFRLRIDCDSRPHGKADQNFHTYVVHCNADSGAYAVVGLRQRGNARRSPPCGAS
jgi:hypothetical protein